MRARAKEAKTCVETVQDTQHLTKGKQHKTRTTTSTCGEQMCQEIQKQNNGEQVSKNLKIYSIPARGNGVHIPFNAVSETEAIFTVTYNNIHGRT